MKEQLSCGCINLETGFEFICTGNPKEFNNENMKLVGWTDPKELKKNTFR